MGEEAMTLSAESYDEALAELKAHFLSGSSRIGFCAQGYEAGGGAIWDDLRIQQAHLKRRSPMHREAVASMAKIDSCLAGISSGSYEILRLGFDPWGQGRCTASVRNWFKLPGTDLALVSLALRTKAARRSFRKALTFEPEMWRILNWWEEVAHSDSKRNFGAEMAEASESFLTALAEYDALRVERVAKERAARDLAGRAARAEVDARDALRKQESQARIKAARRLVA